MRINLDEKEILMRLKIAEENASLYRGRLQDAQGYGHLQINSLQKEFAHWSSEVKYCLERFEEFFMRRVNVVVKVKYCPRCQKRKGVLKPWPKRKHS